MRYAVLIYAILSPATVWAFTVQAVATWVNNDNSAAIIGTRMERSVDGGPWIRAMSVAKGISRITIAIEEGKETCVRFRAYTATAESNPSNEACARPIITTRTNP